MVAIPIKVSESTVGESRFLEIDRARRFLNFNLDLARHDSFVDYFILFNSPTGSFYIVKPFEKKKTVSWIKYHHHNLTKAVHCSVDATLQMTRGWLHSCGWSDINFNHGKRGKKYPIPFQKLVAWFEGTLLRLIPLKLTHLLPWHHF